MIIDTLRPVFIDPNRPGVGWTAQPGGTLDGVTSDDNDATYALTPTNRNELRMAVPSHTPAAAHQRHAIRSRVRVRADSATTQAGQTATSAGTGWSSPGVQFTGLLTPTIIETAQSWKTDSLFALGNSGAVTYAILIRAAGNAPIGPVRFTEAYLDIDTRAQPAFLPDVIDGAGNSQDGGVITDTNRPQFLFSFQTLDGLPARSWRAAIYAQPTTIAPGFDPFITAPIQLIENTGPAPNGVTFNPLPNGQYVIFGEISTTIRITDPFPSAIDSVVFTVDFPAPDPPANPTATVTDFPPSIEVCWEDPETGVAWDDPSGVVAELFRIDCNGTARIATIGDGLTACWVDRFFGLNPEPGCEPDTPCNIQYQVRYWGYSSGILVTTEFTST